jgi:glucose-6-phosphate 1-dehydrogenase
LRGRLSLFLRRDEVEAQWKFTDQLRQDLIDHQVTPLPYAAGSFGPSAATALALRWQAAWAEEARLSAS